MADAPREHWLCPTRVDGTASLIAHTITRARCQERQREHYHKCPTCEHRNGAEVRERSKAPIVLPAKRAPEPAPKAAPEPAARSTPLAG